MRFVLNRHAIFQLFRPMQFDASVRYEQIIKMEMVNESNCHVLQMATHIHMNTNTKRPKTDTGKTHDRRRISCVLFCFLAHLFSSICLSFKRSQCNATKKWTIQENNTFLWEISFFNILFHSIIYTRVKHFLHSSFSSSSVDHWYRLNENKSQLSHQQIFIISNVADRWCQLVLCVNCVLCFNCRTHMILINV